MKCCGSTIDYADERLYELMKAYHKYIDSCNFIRMSEVFKHIVNMPTKRFWVSKERATTVILAIMTGKAELNKMRDTKKEMFQEIFQRVNELRQIKPEISVAEAVTKVIYQPAPKFYLAPGSAKIMVRKAKKEWYNKYKQHIILRHKMKKSISSKTGE